MDLVVKVKNLRILIIIRKYFGSPQGPILSENGCSTPGVPEFLCSKPIERIRWESLSDLDPDTMLTLIEMLSP